MTMQFFADRFAKNVTQEFDYLISAVYAEKMCGLVIGNERIGGVLYPSVQTEGEGINIALSPWYADNCLELEMVVQCTVYKRGNNILLANNKKAVLSKGENCFQLKKMGNPKEYVSRELAMQYLNSR
jgi:hypothetical protein